MSADGRANLGWVVGLRAGLFTILAILGLMLFGMLLMPLGYLPASTLHVFAAAAASNALLMRIFERARLAQIGFAWNAAAVSNLSLGLGGGIAAAALILAPALLTGSAELAPLPQQTADFKSILFVLVLLLFGGIGEEMLFHGYGFQVLLGVLGPAATILPVSVLFGLAHSGNLGFSRLGLANTIGWGILLGYAFWRSRDLWLPIGLHVGWNWTLPVFGVNLSGFTINLTGYAMRWKIHPLWSGGDYGPEAGLLTSAIVVLLFAYLWKVPVRRQQALLVRARPEV